MLTRARAAVLVLAGLTLAACGNVHPGAAAVVDDQTISMKTLDKTAEFYCVDNLIAAKEQKAKAPDDNASVRRQAVTNLVAVIVARKVADKEGVTPKPATYEVPASSYDQVAKKYKGIDVDVAVKGIEDSQELNQIAAALGEKAAGQKLTAENQDQVMQTGYAAIAAAFPRYHVKFAPRFGLNGKLKQVASSGSLSVQGKDDDKPDALPKAQRCS